MLKPEQKIGLSEAQIYNIEFFQPELERLCKSGYQIFQRDIGPLISKLSKRPEVAPTGVGVNPISEAVVLSEWSNGPNHYVTENSSNLGKFDSESDRWWELNIIQNSMYHTNPHKSRSTFVDNVEQIVSRTICWYRQDNGIVGARLRFALRSTGILTLEFGFSTPDDREQYDTKNIGWKKRIDSAINEAILTDRIGRNDANHGTGHGTFYLGNHPGPHTGGGGWGKGTGSWGGGGR